MVGTEGGTIRRASVAAITSDTDTPSATSWSTSPSAVGRITAKTDVSMLRLPRELFFELLDGVPEFAVALSRDLATRLYRLAGAVLRGEKTQ